MSLKFRIPSALICLIFFSIFSGCGEKRLTTEEVAIQAEQLLDAGEGDAAIRILEARLEEEPDRIDLLEPLAFAYITSNDPVMAAFTFSRMAEITPERADARIWAAQSLIEAGDQAGAVGQYRQYLDQIPTDRSIWLTLAELEQELGNLSQSLDAYLKAESLQADGFSQLQIGELYLRLNNLAQAQRWFAIAFETGEPHRGDALLGLLETAIRSKQFKAADLLIEQLDAQYPGLLDQSDLSDIRDQIAAWKTSRAEAEEAVAALERDTAEEAVDEEVVTEEAVAETEPEVEESVTEEPSSVEVAETDVEQAEAEVAEEPMIEEVAVIEPVEEIAPKDPETPAEWLEFARSSAANGETREALSAYKRYLVSNDFRADVWAELSELYYEAGDYRWAQATASEAMRREPEDPTYLLHFLKVAKETMSQGDLMKEMEKAYRKFPHDPEVILVLSKANLEDRNYRNARFLMEHFLDIAPLNHPDRDQVEAVLDRILQGG